MPAVTRRIGILIYDDVTMIDVAGPADVFHHANRFGASYETVLLSVDGGDARASNGLRLTADGSVLDAAELDTVIVPGAYGAIGKPVAPALLEAVRALSTSAHRVVTSTGGVASAYATGGFHGWDYDDILIPLKATAARVGMVWAEPLVVHGARDVTDAELVELSARYRALLGVEESRLAA